MFIDGRWEEITYRSSWTPLKMLLKQDEQSIHRGSCQNYGPFFGVHIKGDIDIDVDLDTDS